MPPPSEKQNTEFALALIRTTSRRVLLINDQITAIGIALSQDRISAREALAEIELIAPGCVDAVTLSIFEGATPEQLRVAGAAV
jgi:hypothetical protein